MYGKTAVWFAEVGFRIVVCFVIHFDSNVASMALDALDKHSEISALDICDSCSKVCLCEEGDECLITQWLLM